ncbi:MAG: hypothetical protein Q9O24_01065 [Gammaproteobacteria bacterium]|nr:hypothetical protein [Gammaproteobacteria bacterium]
MLTSLLNSLISLPFLIAAGGLDYCKTVSGYETWTPECRWQNQTSLHHIAKTSSPNLNSISIWITRDWKEEWYSPDIIKREVIDQGYIPIYIFYWFADDISQDFVINNKDAYFQALRRFSHYLTKIPGEKVVILNPEFNQEDIPHWQGFNQILSASLQMVKSVDGVKAGFCLGDFGNYQIKNDIENWKLFHPSIQTAIEQSDFIAFQEMRALTRNSSSDVLNTAQRSLNFATYLHKTYKKPTFLAYLALSSRGDQAEEQQAQLLHEYADLMPKFKQQAQLIGFNYFHYFDQPNQRGYFLEAEPFFGLHNKKGRAKPSLEGFNRIK